MSDFKYKYIIKRKLGISQYLSLLNYILAYNSEKKSFSLTIKSFMRIIQNLFFNCELYIDSEGLPKNKSYFVDFDDRDDHLDKIDAYVNRLELGNINIKKLSNGINFIANSNRLNRLKMFFSLFILGLYISYIKKLNVFYVLESLAKYSKNYTLGEALATKIEIEHMFSLNFQTSIGFVFGLKSVTKNIRVIAIQHGFITKLSGPNSSKWRDYYSDYYICWSNVFKIIALTRFSGKCNVIVDGGVFDVDDYFEKSSNSRKENNKSILFLSSFSKYANEAILNQEIRAINRLHKLCERSSYDFTVRLHPSVQYVPSFLPNNIKVDLPNKVSLEGSIDRAHTICTISSSSVIIAAKMKKDIMILKSVNDNILNLSLINADIYSTNCIDKIVRNHSQKLKNLEFMFGIQTNNIEKKFNLSLKVDYSIG